MKNLNFVYEISQNYVVNKEYNAVLIDHILKLLIKHAKKEYMEITSCQFFLNNSDLSRNFLGFSRNCLICSYIGLSLSDKEKEEAS